LQEWPAGQAKAGRLPSRARAAETALAARACKDVMTITRDNELGEGEGGTDQVIASPSRHLPPHTTVKHSPPPHPHDGAIDKFEVPIRATDRTQYEPRRLIWYRSALATYLTSY